MELNDLARRVDKMKAAAQARTKATGDEALRTYAQGFCDALKDVSNIIKQAKEAERMRQRLARLENDLSQEPELDWSRAPEGDAGRVSSEGIVSTNKQAA